MDLIERYVYAVGRRLPARQRSDIELELKSLIQDALEARVGDGQPSEADVVAVLAEFGAPAKVAASYTQSGSYVIGPRFYDLYRLIVRIAVGAVGLGLLVSFVVSSLQSGQVTFGDSGLLIASFVRAALSAVGAVTIIFAINERLLPDAVRFGLTDNWDPRQLPPVPQKTERVKTTEVMVGLVFTVLFAVLLNLFPTLFGIHANGPTGWTTIALLSPAALLVYLPIWNAVWLLTLIFSVLVLRQGRYTVALRAFDVIVSCASLVAVLFMLRGPQLISSTLAAELAAVGWSANPDGLASLFSKGYHVVLILATIGTVIDTLWKGYQTIRQATAEARV